jgi:hypothetical protein
VRIDYTQYLLDKRAEAEQILRQCNNNVDSAYWKGFINGLNFALDEPAGFWKSAPSSATRAKTTAHTYNSTKAPKETTP